MKGEDEREHNIVMNVINIFKWNLSKVYILHVADRLYHLDIYGGKAILGTLSEVIFVKPSPCYCTSGYQL